MEEAVVVVVAAAGPREVEDLRELVEVEEARVRSDSPTSMKKRDKSKRISWLSTSKPY